MRRRLLDGDENEVGGRLVSEQHPLGGECRAPREVEGRLPVVTVSLDRAAEPSRRRVLRLLQIADYTSLEGGDVQSRLAAHPDTRPVPHDRKLTLIRGVQQRPGLGVLGHAATHLHARGVLRGGEAGSRVLARS